MEETGSTNTSLEDKTDDFCDNPTRDSLAEGLMSVIKPTLDQLDERVRATKISQLDLKQKLENLSDELKDLAAEKTCPLELELYANKLMNTKHKILVVGNILQASQDRLDKLQLSVNKERSKRKVSTEQLDYESQLITPIWKLDEFLDEVYEPREDTFLLIDSLESNLKIIRNLNPACVLEIGSGSGAVITSLAISLKGRFFLALDINPNACLATRNTAILNNVKIDVIQSDLTSGLNLNSSIDLLIFNPPYIPSEINKNESMLDKAWAGSFEGRSTLSKLMSPKSMGFLVAIEENKPEEMINQLVLMGFNASITAKRKIIGEKLSVIRFSRGIYF